MSTALRGAGVSHAHRLEALVLSAAHVRQAPRAGEIGHVGTCPLCAGAAGCPPCLACRDELRARLREMEPARMPAATWN